MMGDLFGVSLDTLIKGDIEIMKEKVDKSVVDAHLSCCASCLLCL